MINSVVYRMKFPLTLAEERASRGEGKWVLGTVGCWLSISFLLVVLQKQYRMYYCVLLNKLYM